MFWIMFHYTPEYMIVATVGYSNKIQRIKLRLCGAMIYPLCASISRSVQTTSVEGFPCYLYAVYNRGRCLCSERSLIKCAVLAISLLLVLKKLYIPKAETVPALLVYPTSSLIVKTRSTTVTSGQEDTLARSSIREGHYIFPSGRSSTAVQTMYVR